VACGFEASFKHDVRNDLGIKVDVSGYSDEFGFISQTRVPSVTALAIKA
jgi:hypothetical protein